MPRIFVTVGSTHFDPLVHAVLRDEFLTAARGAGFDRIAVQHGRGTLPVQYGLVQGGVFEKHGVAIRLFPFTSEIGREAEESDLVISHAGSASILSALRAGKILIVVPNTTLADNHQVELADTLEGGGYLAVASPESLADILSTVPKRTFSPFTNFKPERFRGIMDEQMGYQWRTVP